MSQQLILISGGSGYIGSHTIATFLASGYRVRVTARDQRSIDKILATHNAKQDSFEVIEVPDITKPGAYDDAVEGVDGVVHMASPFTFNVTDNDTDLIIPAINGTLRVLESVVKHAPQVRRVVVTSSFAAIIDFSKGMAPGHVYDESQWNDMTYEQARDNLLGRHMRELDCFTCFKNRFLTSGQRKQEAGRRSRVEVCTRNPGGSIHADHGKSGNGLRPSTPWVC